MSDSASLTAFDISTPVSDETIQSMKSELCKRCKRQHENKPLWDSVNKMGPTVRSAMIGFCLGAAAFDGGLAAFIGFSFLGAGLEATYRLVRSELASSINEDRSTAKTISDDLRKITNDDFNPIIHCNRCEGQPIWLLAPSKKMATLNR